MGYFERAIRRISGICTAIGAGMLVLIMGMVVTSIILRFFGRVFPGTWELVYRYNRRFRFGAHGADTKSYCSPFYAFQVIGAWSQHCRMHHLTYRALDLVNARVGNH